MNSQADSVAIAKTIAGVRKTEAIILGLGALNVVLAAVAVAVGYIVGNAYVAGLGVVFQGLLYWPIRELIRLRHLQSQLYLIGALPPDRANTEIQKTLQYLRADASRKDAPDKTLLTYLKTLNKP